MRTRYPLRGSRHSRGRLPAILALAVSLLAAPPLCGQVMLGVRGGASIANMSQNDESGAGSRTAFGAGLFLEAPVSPILRFQVEAAWVQKGASSEDTTLELSYVEFSALLKASTSGTPSVHVFAGPAVGINTDCRVSAHLIADIVEEIFGNDIEEGPCDAVSDGVAIETLDFGARGGAGVAMQAGRFTLSFELSYTLGLKEIRGETRDKNRAFLIQTGMAIPVG